MKPLAVIPARRGSKRLPEKNILPLAGKPLLAYSIEAALESGLFEEAVVSTEDPGIGRIAADLGASVHERSEELAGDLVSATDVCLDVLAARRRSGEGHEAVVCLQPTSPLRTAADIRGAWEAFCSAEADFLVSVTPIDPHFFHWAVHRGDDGWTMFFGERFLLERPLLPPVFRPNGSIKIGRAEPLCQRRNFFGPRLTVYETPPERSVHVAEQSDLDYAAFLLGRRAPGGEAGPASRSRPVAETRKR